MIPPTIHGLPALTCLSTMQKAIRRSDERLAMEMACELCHTSKACCTMVLNRLEVISHEDIDSVAAPWVVPYVFAAVQHVHERRKRHPDRPSAVLMPVGNAIMVMCAAPKSRIADHFQAAIGWRSLLEGYKPVIPDWALDAHTTQGKKMGRGLEFFRGVGTKLINEDGTEPEEDGYANEAYRLWAVKERAERAGKPTCFPHKTIGKKNGQLQLA